MKINSFLSILFLILSTCFLSHAQDAKEIVKKSDELLRGSSSKAEMKITVKRPKWERTMSMRAWSKGDKYAMIILDEPSKDKGTVFLKIEKELWNWIPRISRTIKLPASMMSQSWMGTDMSNDELVRQSSLVKDYSHEIISSEKVNERDCYKIKLIPKEDAAVVWGKLIMWIDKTSYVQMKVEQYDEDEYLVNTAKTMKLKKFGSKTLPSLIVITPEEDPENKTTLEYIDLQFDIDLDDDFFSIQNMKRLR